MQPIQALVTFKTIKRRDTNLTLFSIDKSKMLEMEKSSTIIMRSTLNL